MFIKTQYQFIFKILFFINYDVTICLTWKMCMLYIQILHSIVIYIIIVTYEYYTLISLIKKYNITVIEYLIVIRKTSHKLKS